MADTTPQKRVLPARERRESAAKRRASSPIVQSSPAPKSIQAQSSEPRLKRKYNKRTSIVKNDTPTTRASTATPAAEENLPTRVIASKPLPTIREKQLDNLSNREYQSIADSAILVASLHRSRMQWLCEGVFKRYWVKPVKRKGVVEQPPGNPDIKSMQKLGNATITIEPHTFDATFYIVRELIHTAPPPQRHPNQYTAKTSVPPASAIPQNSVKQPAAPTSKQPPETVKASPIKQEDGIQAKTGRVPPPVHNAQAVPPPSGPPKPSDDPVIQMLAARAASDPRLKELMKVVAMSHATPDQLREFQSHIDEFNKIIKARDAKKTETDSKVKSSPAQTGSSSATSAPPPRGGPTHMPPPYMAYPLPPARPEAIIKHVIVEFHSPVSPTQGAATDRWLFPEHAVLEMRAGGMEMIASFFAERKGEDILKSLGTAEEADEVLLHKYKTDKEYFQPITMLIKATQHRTIETIARAAKPLVEVQTHMKSVMKDKIRVSQEYLVHRLPREKTAQNAITTEFVDSGVDISEAEDDELKDNYGI